MVARMSDNGATAIPPQTLVECGVCGKCENISWFCKNCPASLCDTCSSSHHTKRRYKSHCVVQRTYTVLRLYGSAKIAEQCRIHPEKEISSYCNECNVPCCITCLAKGHQRHEFCTIEDKYLDAERCLNDYITHLDTDIKPILDRMEEHAKGNAKEDNTYVEKVINDINDFRKDVVQNFNNACDNLIHQVQEISDKNNEGLREIEKSKEYLESLNRVIQEKIQKGDLDLMKYVPPKLETLVPKLKTPKKALPSFKPARKVFDVIQESVGIIQIKEKKNKEQDQNACIKSPDIPQMYSFQSKIAVSSLTKAGGDTAWVMSGKSTTMYLYNDMGKVVKSVTVKGSEGINDMAITRLGEIIITCTDKKVRRVSLSGKVSTLMDTAPFASCGVCLTDKEEIVVCMGDQDDENHVAVYSHDGRSKVRDIRCEDGQGKHLITDPYRVVQNGQGLCVVNVGTNVVCLNEGDNLRWVYDGMQAKLEKPFNPRGICVDKQNNLLVIDRNSHCVHYIDREGGLLQVILTHEQTGLQRNWGICVDNVTGQVWMGNSSKDVVIANTKNVLKE